MRGLVFLTAVFIFALGGVIFLHDPSAEAQQPPVLSPNPNIEKQFDAQLNRVEEKVSRAEQVKVSTKPKVIYKIRKVYVVKEVLPEEHKVLLNIGGNQYEADPTIYKGYILIDVDSIQKAIVEQDIEEAMYTNDTLSQVMIEEANGEINKWKEFKQKVKTFFKRKN